MQARHQQIAALAQAMSRTGPTAESTKISLVPTLPIALPEIPSSPTSPARPWYDDRQIGKSRAFVARNAWLQRVGDAQASGPNRHREETGPPAWAWATVPPWKHRKHCARKVRRSFSEHANNGCAPRHRSRIDRPSTPVIVRRTAWSKYELGEHGEPVAVGHHPTEFEQAGPDAASA